MNISLRNYQQPFYDAIVNYIKPKIAINKIAKTVGYLPTGGGKSVIIGKLANELEGRTLVLTSRIEILLQNSDWLDNYGVLTSKIDTARKSHKTVIAMVQTLDSRIKSFDINYIGSFDNIIVDECHIDIYHKVYSKYNYKVLIGMTGTPIINKKKYQDINGIKYSRDLTLSDYYDKLIQTIDSQDLVDAGYLTQDYNIILQQENLDKLKPSASTPDGYTIQSLNSVYTNTASIKTLMQAYGKYCIGKKTMIFNPSTKVNDYVYKALKGAGINVKVYDSKSGGNRNEIIKWFNNNRDAVLINANVFTTGFNVTDVECIIVNRATKSLSLWIQMVGRGSRITDKIYKDKFTVIDLGNNVYNHGPWSKPRDWSNHFWSGQMKPVKSLGILSTWECITCGAINELNELKCCNCDMLLENNFISEDENKSLKTRSGTFIVASLMPIPKANSIIQYTIRKNEGAAFAFSLAEVKILELFKHYKVTKEYYDARKSRFRERIRKIYLPIYFAIIKNKELNGANRTLDKMLQRLYNKINKMY